MMPAQLFEVHSAITIVKEKKTTYLIKNVDMNVNLKSVSQLAANTANFP